MILHNCMFSQTFHPNLQKIFKRIYPSHPWHCASLVAHPSKDIFSELNSQGRTRSTTGTKLIRKDQQWLDCVLFPAMKFTREGGNRRIIRSLPTMVTLVWSAILVQFHLNANQGVIWSDSPTDLSGLGNLTRSYDMPTPWWCMCEVWGVTPTWCKLFWTPIKVLWYQKYANSIVIQVRGTRCYAILVQFVFNADQGRAASIDLVISFPHLKGGHNIWWENLWNGSFGPKNWPK